MSEKKSPDPDALDGTESGTGEGTSAQFTADDFVALKNQVNNLTSSIRAVTTERDTYKTQLGQLADKDTAASGDVTKALTERDTWKGKYDQVLQEQKVNSRKSKAAELADKRGFIDSDVVLLQLGDTVADLDDKDLEKAIEKLAEEKSQWLRAPGGEVRQAGAGSRQSGDQTNPGEPTAGMSTEEAARYNLGLKIRQMALGR